MPWRSRWRGAEGHGPRIQEVTASGRRLARGGEAAYRLSTLRRVRVRGGFVLVDDRHPPNISAFTFL